MTKVLLHAIGSPLPSLLSSDQARENARRMNELDEGIHAKRAEVRAGWGEEYVKRVHQKGKLTAWERIDLLRDPDFAPFCLGTLVNYGLTFGEGREARTSPGAGVVTCVVRAAGRYVVVVANDNTVASGSWWPRTPEKIQRAQEFALKLRLPIVYLVDSSGLFLPEQASTFPGRRGAGHIFKLNSLLSDRQVPQIAGVLGDCIAGGGYMPIISDKVFMSRRAYMVIAGAALIKGGKSQELTSHDIGGPHVHVAVSGCADFEEADDAAVIRAIRREIERLPGSAVDYYRNGNPSIDPAHAPSELSSIFPADPRKTYDVRQVIARLADASGFWEILPDRGPEMICGIARISGLPMGIVANNLQLTDHPRTPGMKRLGGILYREGVAKVGTFVRACDDDGIPLIWLQDVSGFDIGAEAEKEGLLGFGSSLLYSNSTATVPSIAILLRRASGAGYYAMHGLPYDPLIQLATPMTRLAVMEGRTLAIGAYRTKLDDHYHPIAATEEERRNIEAGMAEIEARIEKDMDPVAAASRMDVDEIVRVEELRPTLTALAEMCHQSTGYRRVKNPRIWSLHDLAAIHP